MSSPLTLVSSEQVLLSPTEATFHEAKEQVNHSQQSLKGWPLPRFAMYCFACLMVIFTSGGLILGFGPIYTTMVTENQWGEVCGPDSIEEGSVTCPEQEVYLQYIYSTSFLALSLANALFGVILDMTGPRTTVFLGLLIASIGNFMMAYGDSKNHHGLSIIAGFALIGIGGFATYISSFQIIQLFEKQGILCSILSGLFNASGYVYLLLLIDGITRQNFFLFYGLFIIVCSVICYVVYPLESIVSPNSYLRIGGRLCQAPKFTKPHGLWKQFKKQLKRVDLWYFWVFFGWISTLFAFTGGAIPNIMTKVSTVDQEDTLMMYINYCFPLIMNGAFLFSPIAGHLIDTKSFQLVFTLSLVLVQLLIVCLLIPSLHFQIVSLIVFAMAQASFYALQFSYIMMCFPVELYGSLQAFLAIGSLLMGLLNYVFTPWTQNQLNGNYLPVFLIFGIPTFGFYFGLKWIQEPSIFKQNQQLEDTTSIVQPPNGAHVSHV